MKFFIASSLLALSLLLNAAVASAADRPIPPAATPSALVEIWPAGQMPGHGADGPETNLPPHGDHATRITGISHPTLSLCLLPKSSPPAPAVIVCPGGGYNYVVYDKEGTEIAAWLNSIGLNALVLKYRVPHNRAGAFQDVQRAIRLTRARAQKWNLDPQKIGIIGFSAGGDLAAQASSRFGGRSYPAIDAVDRQSDRPDFTMLVYPAYLERDGKLSTNLDLQAKIPPTLIIHNADDLRFAPGSQLYHAALDAAHDPNEFVFYQTGGHGYGLRSDQDVRAWPQAAEQWLEKIGVLNAAAPASVNLPADRKNFHIYLLMGQSNMQGRDTTALATQATSPRVLALEDGHWVMARDPLFPPHGRIQPGVGPGIPFALAMLKADPNATIGLVPCAVGGTPLRRWVKGGDLYERTLKLARQAEISGVIAGVLWHQGESDTGSRRDADTYEARLTQMFQDLRHDLGKPGLPIVVGQLGDFLSPEKSPYADTVRAALRHLPAVMKNVGYAGSTGLVDKGDHLHFNGASARELGVRFAKAMQTLKP